jgi:hypothetical protein
MTGMLIKGAKLVATLGMTALLAGCTMGSMFGGGDDQRFADVSAIATECPPIRIREGTGSYRVFAGNRTSDPQALRYQGVIDNISRNCVASNGLITVRMGASGRVIPGASGSPGSVNMPLRFAVERDGMVLFSQRYDVPVAISGASAAEFAQTIENVAIPYVGGESITIWVGFDS